ncbi:hypothetical protein [Streptomyces sp. CBG33]|uniref:hypothetical protein n=1 Tax=Streptomyces sp. CBG33 TaxID=2762624 RepID=UPI0016487D21|nr:hypothetical protein [Streptomyces sp. CBG33]
MPVEEVPSSGSWVDGVPEPPSEGTSPEGVSSGAGAFSSSWSPEGWERLPVRWLMVGPESPLRAWPETSSQPVIPPIARTKTAAALITGRFQRPVRAWWVVASPNSPVSGPDGSGTARRRRVAWSASAGSAAGTRRARVASGPAWPRSWVAPGSA